MSVSELINELTNHLIEHGDSNVFVLVRNGKDEDGVNRAQYYDKIETTESFLFEGAGVKGVEFQITCSPPGEIIWKK